MKIAEVKVGKTTCKVTPLVLIPQGIVGATISIEYTDPAWDGLQKTVVFRSAVTKDVLDAGNEVVIPAEVVSRAGVNLYMGVYGVGADGRMVIPTIWKELGLVHGAAAPSGDASSDPSLPVWAQIQAMIGNLTAQQVGADPAGTAVSAVTQHNTDATAHNDLRLAMQGLSDRVNAALDSDDTTLDQMSEVVAYIKSNKTLIEAITTSKVSVADIVNDLVTNAANKPLSAAQGVALKKLIDDLQKMIPDRGPGISVIGATVGQTVKISAVDENGAPTAWEPADFPSGGGNADLTDEEYAALVALLEEE